MSDCLLCGELRAGVIVDTDRGESLPSAAEQLTTLWRRTDDGPIELRMCSVCGAWFALSVETSDETLHARAFSGANLRQAPRTSWMVRKLAPEAWVLLEKMVHGDLDPATGILAAARRHLGYDIFFKVVAQVPRESFVLLMPELAVGFFSHPFDPLSSAFSAVFERCLLDAELGDRFLDLVDEWSHPLPRSASALVARLRAQRGDL